jgi:hypothetical protein
MAQKTAAQEKKTTAGKSTAAKAVTPAKKSAPAKAATSAPAKARKAAVKTASPRKVSKGDTLSCEVCGFSVVVDEVGDVTEIEEIICCDQPMKKKASRAKAAAR